ncbi:MAG: class I SAM-dependent methyltransferase [Bacteroidetes bacterium]|nr:MAG: class I SAM-dependent methyltransferase [Bacteroidota bacterium]PTM09092.1 MAG: class I SAM-dependent methyltransferase [Bacteroidota bacterium]
MSNLYHQLAPVYEAMYQTFMDYPREFAFYSSILRQYQKKNLLELGCGTGNLAPYFTEAGFGYQGLDLSEEMISLARKKYPQIDFSLGDMRRFTSPSPSESILIPGRSISYLLTNADVNATFATAYSNLKDKGIFCFDFIDAQRFIPPLANGKTVFHEASSEGVFYQRESHWSLNLVHGMDFRWVSVYYQKAGDEWQKIGADDTVIRAFTRAEIEIFLAINNFQVQEVIDRPSYAFPTYVVVAQRR